MRAKLEKNKTAIVLVLLWVVVLGVLFYQFRDQLLWPYHGFVAKEIRIDFDLALDEINSAPEQGAFYYDLGDGFKEQHSVKFEYNQAPDGRFKHYSVPLKREKKVFQLRFDPLSDRGRLRIRNMTVRYHHERDLDLRPGARAWVPTHAVEKIVPIEGGMQITANGADPHILLTGDFSDYGQWNGGDVVDYIGWSRIAAGVGVMVLIVVLCLL